MTKIERYWDVIVSFMNDNIREEVHGLLAPCTKREFLREYVKRDIGFADLLYNEFSIDLFDTQD